MALTLAVCFVGWLVGLISRRRGPTLTQWLVVVLMAAFVINFAASMYIMAVDDPWSSGGTIAKHHPDRVLSAPLYSFLDMNALGVIMGSAFVLGCAVGSAKWFRRGEPGSSRRMWACVGASLSTYVLTWILFFAYWM
jgi:hypothetical protein